MNEPVTHAGTRFLDEMIEEVRRRRQPDQLVFATAVQVFEEAEAKMLHRSFDAFAHLGFETIQAAGIPSLPGGPEIFPAERAGQFGSDYHREPLTADERAVLAVVGFCTLLEDDLRMESYQV